MNRYKHTNIIGQGIFFFLFLWTATLQIASAQLTYKNTDEPSLPEKYIHLKKGDTLSIYRILKEDIPVDAVDKRGRTLLMQKALEGDTMCLKYLIKVGADINKRHRSGDLEEYLYTALDYAIIGKQKKTIDILRHNGALWEEERQKSFSTISKLDYRIDADMLNYILTKGVRFGESEKLLLLVSYVTLQQNVHMQREIVRICLSDTLEVTPEKVKPYINKWERLNLKTICDRIMELQEEEFEIRDLPRRKAFIQDSLQRLLAEGKEDTIRYVYTTYTNGDISVSPRVDSFRNRVGDGKDWLVVLTSAIVSFFLLARLVWKYLKEEWKQIISKCFFLMGVIWFVIGTLFYLPFSILYVNLDDYYTRLHGQKYTAEANYQWKMIKVRNAKIGYHSEMIRKYSFTFISENGVTTSINQGLCNFSKYDDTEQKEKLLIKYMPDVHKLSIADASNTSDNLLEIGISSSVILFLIALLMGKLGFLYKIWKKFRGRKLPKGKCVGR